MSDIILPLPFYTPTPSTCPPPCHWLCYITFPHKQLGERIELNWIEICCVTSEKIDQTKNLEKSRFCTLHLQMSLTRWSVTMMMQARCQIIADELLLILVHNWQDYILYPWNSWPLNFGYLFLGTPCIVCKDKVKKHTPAIMILYYNQVQY